MTSNIRNLIGAIWRYVNQLAMIFAVIVIVWVLFGGKFTVKTGDWKVYSSNELGYQIAYPSHWSAESFPVGFENLHRGLGQYS